jgi:hypothetical protein
MRSNSSKILFDNNVTKNQTVGSFEILSPDISMEIDIFLYIYGETFDINYPTLLLFTTLVSAAYCIEVPCK